MEKEYPKRLILKDGTKVTVADAEEERRWSGPPARTAPVEPASKVRPAGAPEPDEHAEPSRRGPGGAR